MGPCLSSDLTLDRARLDRVRHGATVVTTEPAVFRIAGPGALGCLQGMLTNDLEKPGDDSLVYGAMLTPKGMIVVDAWVLRQADALTRHRARRGTRGRARHLPAHSFRRVSPGSPISPARRGSSWLLGGHGFQVLAKSGIGRRSRPGG